MASYVVLINWTEEGIKNYKESPERAEAAAREFEGVGVRFTDLYWTLGPYDIVAVVEAPDDESLTAAMLKVGSLGNIRTTTLRAFNRDQFRAIIAKTG